MNPTNDSLNTFIDNINMDSVKDICGKSEQVMIYGWQHCGYDQLGKRLEKLDSPIKRVFDWSLGNLSTANPNKLITLEGRRIEQVNVPEMTLHTSRRKDDTCARFCKSGLTNIVLENYKRMKEGKTIIPVLFVFDRDNNPFPPASSTSTSRDAAVNDLITSSELRRCYKLCKDAGNHEIEKVAQQTFKFVKLTEDPKTHKTNLVETKPIWEDASWDKEWKERLDKKTPKMDKIEDVQWRKELNNRIHVFENPSLLLANKKLYLDEYFKLLETLGNILDDMNQQGIAITLPNYKNFISKLSAEKQKLYKIVDDPNFTENVFKDLKILMGF